MDEVAAAETASPDVELKEMEDNIIINDIMDNPNNYMMFEKLNHRGKRHITGLTINEDNSYTLALTDPDNKDFPSNLVFPRNDLVNMLKKNKFLHPTWKIRKIKNGGGGAGGKKKSKKSRRKLKKRKEKQKEKQKDVANV